MAALLTIVLQRSLLRNMLMYGLHTILRIVGVGHIRDTQCGFKLFSRKAAQHIFPAQHLPTWIFDVELLLLAKQLGIPVAEVPIEWHEVPGSKLNVFTASLPPSVVATAAASIRKLMHADAKRAHLWKNSRRLHAGLREMGFQLGTETAQSAIIAVILPDMETTVRMWQALLELGLYVNTARPPATPQGTFLLRCSLCAEHRPEQIERVLALFEHAGRAVGAIG